MKKLLLAGAAMLCLSCSKQNNSPDSNGSQKDEYHFVFNDIGKEIGREDLVISKAYIIKHENTLDKELTEAKKWLNEAIARKDQQSIDHYTKYVVKLQSSTSLTAYTLIFLGPDLNIVKRNGNYDYVSGKGDAVVLKFFSDKTGVKPGKYSEWSEYYQSFDMQFHLLQTFLRITVDKGNLDVQGKYPKLPTPTIIIERIGDRFEIELTNPRGEIRYSGTPEVITDPFERESPW